MSCSFPLGAVLTVTTGRLLCRIDDLYALLNHMTGDNLYTHQLPRASRTCEGPLIAQHPQLADVAVPNEFGDEDAVWAWVREQESVFGAELSVDPLDSWQRKDPITELAEMRGGIDNIIVVVTE